MITILHKSNCSTSIKVLNLLKASGKKYVIRDYINEPLNELELTVLLEKLKINAEDLIRKKEDIFKNNYQSKSYDNAKWIKILASNPILIERPILIKRTTAIIARPYEAAEKYLK